MADKEIQNEKKAEDGKRNSSSVGRRDCLKLTGAGALAALGGGTLLVNNASAVTEGGPANQEDWTVAFEDNFDSGTLDTSSWGIGWGWGVNTNNGPSTIVEENVEVSNGMLRLHATPGDSTNYYVGGVHSKNNVTFSPPVYLEARMRSMDLPGSTNAFWSKPNSEAWPPEIDFMECPTARIDETMHNIHYSGSGTCGDSSTHQTSHNGSTTASRGNYAEDFYIFGCLWTGDEIAHYVDGNLIGRTTDSNVLNSTNNCGDFYMMLNNLVGGWPPGEVPPESDWDNYKTVTEVDWVRVWDYTPGSGSTGDSTDSEHYLWARSGDGNEMSFAFEASGGNVRLDPESTTEDYWVSEDGTTGGGTTSKTSSLPGFRYAGEITDLKYSGSLDLFVDNQSVDPDSLVDSSNPGPDEPSSLPNTLTIDGSNYSGTTSYSFSVSDAVEPTDSTTDEDIVSDNTVEGSVGSGSDTYEFSGDLTSLTLDGEADVYLNGTRVDLLVVSRAPDSSGAVHYIVESDATFLKAKVPSASINESDRIDGSKLFGEVWGGSDAFWVVDGTITDVSTFGGDVVTTVNGSEVDFTN